MQGTLVQLFYSYTLFSLSVAAQLYLPMRLALSSSAVNTLQVPFFPLPSRPCHLSKDLYPSMRYTQAYM